MPRRRIQFPGKPAAAQFPGKPLTRNLAPVGYQRDRIREMSRLRIHVPGEFPGKSSSRDIPREIPREMPRRRIQFPGKSAASQFPGKFPGKLDAQPRHFPGNCPGRWLPHPISREISREVGSGSQILPISPILYGFPHNCTSAKREIRKKTTETETQD